MNTTMVNPTYGWFAIVCLVCLLGSPLPAAEPGLPGTIQFSNGDRLEGKISLTPNTAFILHGRTQVWTVALNRIREIRCTPEKEELVRAWRFPEAGQTRKEYYGDPYPIRHLQTTILTGQEILRGHLLTTVLYVEAPDRTRKVILYAKQRGKEGETLVELAYPTSILLHPAADAPERGESTRIPWAGTGGPPAELSALTQPALVRLAGQRNPKTNDYVLPPTLGNRIFLAVKSGAVIHVGWPSATNVALTAQVTNALIQAKDFFDVRDLLGVFRDNASRDDIYALILLSRRGTTTFDGDRTQPWRLSVWRWKCDLTDLRLMLAGRGDFFRGIIALQGESLPQVILSDSLWSISQDDKMCVIKDRNQF
ncbi:MAG: hypothetical protein PHW60_05410 [Kiritimatiellae bacterium]|nr:hypothetical protein [Kiritimatiellia bacterium]